MTETAKKPKLTDEEILQKIKEKEAALRMEIRKREKAISEKKRKERTRDLIEKGGLVEIAGLLHCDPQLMTGALLDIARTIKTDALKAANWKQEGSYVLSLTPADRKEQGIGL